MASIPLYRTADLRRIEAAAVEQPLMQRAGEAAADLACALCGEHGAAVLILAGPGNNGGDAFEAARLLHQRFFDTQVVFAGSPDRLPKDAEAAYQRFIAAGGRTLDTIPLLPRWSLIIDGLFGIGLQRAITGGYAELVRAANHLAARDRCPLLALDCPSGLDADTGRPAAPTGEQEVCATIIASHTISFIAGKPGLYTADGPDHCGTVSIARLGLEVPALLKAPGLTIDCELFSAHLRQRPQNSHKGSNGNAGILGGANGMVGAALLAGRAALKLGSGRVYLGLIDPQRPGFDPAQAELMLRQPSALLATDLTALACGPGMGCSHEALVLLEKACALDLPLVLDADALNLVAAEGNLQVALASREYPTLLTPHPAEAARLLAADTPDIQADRIAAALEIASRYNALVALKGCGTIIASPDGRWFLNTSGNPGLASAGTGDVLTGILTALLTQGWPALEALLAAVHLHGTAADARVAAACGPVGLTASEVIDEARGCLNRWIIDAC